ncbi:MAG: hypothetical protein OXR66_04560 [Candidatus Woesearchaeota archaeon]|nr:hypothetical protein [Candidatus Woesearchaeota archaeon]
MELTILKNAGLTEGETKVYLALLELGSSTTGPIIEKSGIARSIVYQILEKLMQKGIVSYITKEKTKYYQAAEPHKILEYIDERKERLEKNRKEVETLLPQLMLLQESAPESEVKIFQGFKGLITVHEHTYQKLSKGEGYFFFGITPAQPTHFHAYWQRDHIRRAEAGITCKLLFHPDTEETILENRNSYDGCDARYMPLMITTPSWFMGYKDVAVISFISSNPITIEIVNKEIADSFHAYFDEFWKQSEKFRKRTR